MLKQYGDLLQPEFKSAWKMSHVAGLVYGYSKFIENSCIGIILYFATLILVRDDSLDGEKVFIAVFAMIFGAFGAGQAASYGPDATKGNAAAVKIFSITDTPTSINAVDEDALAN